MDANTRITQLEDEFKVLKNEVLAVLLDIKENVLNTENPFTRPASFEMPTVNITQSIPAPQPEKIAPPRSNGNGHGGDHNIEDKPVTATVKDKSPREKENRPAAESRSQSPVEEFTTGIIPQDTQSGGAAADEDPFKVWASGTDCMNNSGHAMATLPAGNDLVSLDSLVGLIAWVKSTSARMGTERTQTILDLSEMMGQIPVKLKGIMEKFIPASIDCPSAERIPARVYLDALKDLARLLNKKNASDFIVLHIVSHGLSSIARTG